MKQFFGKKSRRILTLVIMISLALHVLAILIFGTIKFVSAVLREETVFESAPIDAAPQQEPEYKVNIEQRNQSTPPPTPKVFAVDRASDLDIPALNIDLNVESSAVFGRNAGEFKGLTAVREMATNFSLTDFGYTGRAANTLESTLIDLKRDRSGKPVPGDDRGRRKTAIREFTDGTWKLSNLTNKFYAAKNKLYASYWMIRFGSASRAPQAFGVEGEIAPTGIVAYYEGSYMPTENMNMRFCGMGDDVLIVRLNSRTVLDASWEPGYSKLQFNQDGPKLPGIPKPIRNGEWLNLKAGETYDLKILVAEIPGGSFGCFLFYQIKGEEKLRVFSTKPITNEEKKVLREVNQAVADAL